MAQDRMIRASMRSSEKVSSWPIPLRYFWTQLWGYCDDHGRGRYDPRLVRADCFPLDDEVTAETVGRWLQALEMAGVIARYEAGGKQYFACVHWDEHQPLRHKRKSYIPAPAPVDNSSAQNFAEVPKKVPEREREREREIEGERESAKRTPHCEIHPNGTTAPCRACGDARRAYDAAAKAPRPVHLPSRVGEPEYPEHTHRWTKDGTCVLCPERRELAS
jgi:hypothetical protein